MSKGDVICGVPAPAARQLMRAYQLDRPTGVACGVLGLDRGSAERQMRLFEAAGYVQRSTRVRDAEDAWWVTTIRGNALAQASFGRPISRATATRLLGQVIDRARAYNADPARLLTVARIAVFGSYLAPGDDPLGDLDLAVSAVQREADGQRHVERSLEYAETSGRDFKAFTDMLFWPERELQMILTNRSAAISITSEDITRFTGRFQLVYEVGDDAEAIPLPQHHREPAATEDPTNAR